MSLIVDVNDSGETPNPNARYPANPDAPRFEPQYWVDSTRTTPLGGRPLSVAANCYQYALAGSHADGSNKIYNEPTPSPGDRAGMYDLWLTQGKTSVERYQQLLEADGIGWAAGYRSGLDSQPIPAAKPGHYLVGVYLKDGDYHFVRQDRDGGWSEKPGADDQTHVRRFLEPAEDGGYKELPNEHSGYRFAGYAYVPKQGVDGGLEHFFQKSLVEHAANGKTGCPEAVQKAIDELKFGSGVWDFFRQALGKFNTPESVTHFSECKMPTPKGETEDRQR